MPSHKTTKIKKPRPVGAKDRLAFTENLQLLISAGISPGSALTSLRGTSKSRRFLRALDYAQHEVSNGSALWKALKDTGLVSLITLSLIRIGEETGQLSDNLRIAVRLETKYSSLQSHIKSALVYPMFVVGLTVIVGLGVAWFLLPKLKQTFDQLDVELPLITQVIMGIGDFLQAYGVYVVPLFAVLVSLAGYFLFVSPKTRHIGYRLLLRAPGIGALLRQVEVAKFGYLMAALLKSGVTITRAMQLIAFTTDTIEYRRFYASLYKSFDNGYSFQRSLEAHPRVEKILPWSVQQIIVTGEQSGSLSASMEVVGSAFEEKAENSSKNIESVIEPILLVIVWFGVLVVAIAVLLPIYSLIGGLET